MFGLDTPLAMTERYIECHGGDFEPRWRAERECIDELDGRGYNGPSCLFQTFIQDVSEHVTRICVVVYGK